MKAPEKLGVVGSSLGDEDGEEVRTKTTSPPNQKENYSMTNVKPARNFPADHKGGIWGLASVPDLR